MKLELSRLHFPITTLGPGRRIGIWFQGCSIRCPGCVSADTWASGIGSTTVKSVIAAISPWLAQADGITVSGGEPFDQPIALRELLLGLRTLSPADVLVYSGYPIEQISLALQDMQGLIDVLITDRYERGAPQTLMLRGSDNQRLHLMTPLGQERFASFDRLLERQDMTLDVMFDEDGTVWLAGIPRRGAMSELKRILAKDGHLAITTEAHSLRSQHD